MYEICLHCNRSFYSGDFAPGCCPVCEETLKGPDKIIPRPALGKVKTERLVPRI